MTNEDAMGLPHIERVGADDIQFHRLDVDDLFKWANEVKQARRIAEENRVKQDTTLRNNPELQQKLIRDVAMQDVEFGDLWRRTFTPAGARKVLIESLKKGGKGDGDAVAVLKRIHWTRQQVLAEIVMSPPREEQEKKPPLTGSDTAETTSPSEPASPDSAESPNLNV